MVPLVIDIPLHLVSQQHRRHPVVDRCHERRGSRRHHGVTGAEIATRFPQPGDPQPVVVRVTELVRLLVYLWDDQGTVCCLELKTGKQAWNEQFTGPTYTSPVSDGKRIFGISRMGELVVLAASPEYRELGRYKLPEGTHATPAIAHGSLFIRTFNHLMRVGPSP